MFRSSTFAVLAFSTVCAALVWAGLSSTGHPFTWPFALLLGYFFLITVVLLRWQEAPVGTDLKRFVRRFMAGLVIKLMLSLILLFLLVKSVNPADTGALVVTFSGLYLGYLAFSTVRLGLALRSAQKPAP